MPPEFAFDPKFAARVAGGDSNFKSAERDAVARLDTDDLGREVGWVIESQRAVSIAEGDGLRLRHCARKRDGGALFDERLPGTLKSCASFLGLDAQLAPDGPERPVEGRRFLEIQC